MALRPEQRRPYLNIAYPDSGTVYWGAAFTVPKGAKLHIEGQFPHARYMSVISYDFKGAPIESMADYLFKPLPGSTNPYLDGADRTSAQRSYRIEVLNEPLTTPMRWRVYLKGEPALSVSSTNMGMSTSNFSPSSATQK